jgi:T5SS/PEP-CTERM-associated repeat protein
LIARRNRITKRHPHPIIRSKITIFFFALLAGNLAASTTYTNAEVTTATLNSSTTTARVYNVLNNSFNCTLFTGATFVVGDTSADYSNDNALTISGGATLTSDLGIIGEGVSFESRGSRNTVTVTGSGSTLNCILSLYVGNLGNYNTLRIENGGYAASSSTYIGDSFSRASALGHNNKLIVTGNGSSFVNTAILSIGEFGCNNALMVTDGGSVSCGDIALGVERANCNGNYLLATGEGSALSASGIAVGETGDDCTATVSDGASVTCDSFTIGSYFAGNMATVTGQGSSIAASSTLTVGGSAKGTLTIANGGIVSVGKTSSTAALSVGGHIRLAGGYLAVGGDARSTIDNLISNGLMLVRDASTGTWETATTGNVTVTYYSANENAAAASATGYSWLGDYTVVNGGAVMPEFFGSAAVLANGWYDSPWYGSYWANVANGGYWIWHSEHGWQYLANPAKTAAVIWDDATQSWWYVGKELYPYMYNYSKNGWYYYIEGTTPDREFWSYADNARVNESAIAR